MKNKNCALSAFMFLFLTIQTVSAQLAARIYTPITSIICNIYSAVLDIAGALAACVFMIAAVKWIASRDDAGARNSARTAMVHAIIGIIVILIAKVVVGGITSSIGFAAAAICP